MKVKFILTSLLFLGLAFSQQSFAQVTPKVAKRQVVQKNRIKHGMKNGELTKKEAAGLKAQQRHINRSKKRAKADGKVTARERNSIRRKQNRASRNIKRQKNDPQSRN